MMILIYNCKCKFNKISLCINMSKCKQYRIHFKYNIIKEVDEDLLNNYVRYIIFLHIYYQNHWKSKNLFIRKPLYKKKSTEKNSFL